MDQHERALAAYIDTLRDREDALAVILTGSVARGEERPDSDVDVYLVVSDESFARSERDDRFAWVERRGFDYPGSYIDIKLACPRYLEAAAARGDDPTRASFASARVAYAREPGLRGLDSLVVRIATLPEEAWDRRVRSYVAQVRLYGGYFLPQGAGLGDLFLIRHAAVHLTLAAARAALAAARVLMPGPKYLSKLLRQVPTPDGFVAAWQSVVDDPCTESAAELVRRLDAWLGGEITPDDALSTFIRDNELTWLRGGVPPEFL